MPNQRRCTNCGYYSETKQQHPYGSTTATEYLSDCAADDDMPGDAPANPGVDDPCPLWKHYREVEEETADGKTT